MMNSALSMSEEVMQPHPKVPGCAQRLFNVKIYGIKCSMVF